MMETKRNRQWRKHHARRVFKARLTVLAACRTDERRLWFELANEKWVRAFKTTGKPCSYWMCRGEDFDRKAAKKETRRLVEEFYEEDSRAIENLKK